MTQEDGRVRNAKKAEDAMKKKKKDPVSVKQIRIGELADAVGASGEPS